VQRSYAGWLYHGHVPDAAALAWFVFENIFIVGYEFLSCAAVNLDTGALYFPTLAWREPLPALDYAFIGPAWSLSLEITFYVLAPYLVRRPWRMQLGLVAASTLLRWGCNWYFHLSSPYFFNSCFPFELAFFMSGSLAYQVYIRYSDAILRAASRWQWARWFFYAIVIAYSRLPGPDILHYRCFVCVLFIMLPVLFTLTKNIAWDRLTGELSYSFYLGHTLIIVLTSALIMRLPENRWGVAYLLACLCFSYLIYRFVESKIDRWRESLLERRPRAPAEAPAPVAT
jgi:peptidoglycan/LPS O-acetylase OafA/YrhL